MKTKKSKDKSADFIKITPLRNFLIYQPPEYDLCLEEGVEVEIPKKFEENLKTEHVIVGR